VKHLNEYREYKKPKSNYSKVINISKIELRDLCLKLNLNSNEMKYLGCGSYGNAYRVGDKVLKITEHKDEAKSVYNLIKHNFKIPGIVNYHSVNMFKHKNEYLYVIVMDYVQPLNKFLEKKFGNYHNQQKIIDYMLDIVWDKWDKLKLYNYFVKLVGKKYDTDNRTIIYLMEKVWDLYQNLQPYLPKCPDLQTGNIGVKDDKFIYYDYASCSYVRKYNDPSLI